MDVKPDQPMVYINGWPEEHLSIFDRAFQYGDGLFETIAVKDGEACLLDLHIKRLESGLKTLSFPPIDLNQLTTDIKTKIQLHKNSILKLIVTRGVGERGYKAPKNTMANIIFIFSKQKFDLNIDNLKSVSLCLCKTPVSTNPVLAGLKHLNRLENVIARNEWNNDEFDEGLMFDSQNNLIEATSANIFLLKNNCLYTPNLENSGILGVIREVVIDMAKTLSIPLKITEINIDDCYNADALFLTNSLIGISPVNKIEKIEYLKSNWPIPLFEKVIEQIYA